MATLKQLAEKRPAMTSGHRMCSGCTAPIIVKLVSLAAQKPLVISCATGCLEVASTIYPYSAWNCSFIHNAFENSAATMSGVETAYRALKKKGKVKDEIQFIAFGGDGGSYDIGLQSISGAMERGHNMLFVCLPPETEIILEDGSIVKIGQLVDETIEKYLKKRQIVTVPTRNWQSRNYSIYDEIEVIESSPIKESILSWNGREFLPMETVRVQRKNSPDRLIKVTTSSGLTLKLTEEHPVLIDGENGSEWKEAALLKVGDEVYSARKINIFNKGKFHLIDLLAENKCITITLPAEIKNQINNELRNKFETIKKAAEYIPFKYRQFKEQFRKVNLHDLKIIYQQMPKLSWENLRDNIDEFVVQGGNVIKVYQKQLNENILYLLGLISSDGHIGKRNYGVTFVTKDAALVKVCEKVYGKVIKGRKISKIKDKKGMWHLTMSDPIIYILAQKFDIKNNPKELIKISEHLIAAFLKGYFDGDGHCSILDHRHSREARIILSTTRKLLADRIRLMLQRLGIAGFQDKREHRFDITISSKEDIKKFIEVIGSNSPAKKAAMRKVKILLANRKLQGKYFSLAPRVCARWLKKICEKHNIPITSIDKKRNICTLATLKRRATKEKIKEYLSKIESLISEEPLIYRIKNLLINDFYLDPIRSIESVKTESKYVYDLTIEPSHVFVPEGKFVISNCYDNEAYMNTGVQRSSATPKGAATTTSPAGKVAPGKKEFRKDLTRIMVAHKIPYVAQASPGHWNDLVKKVEKALSIEGPKFMNVLMPCTLGWRFPTNMGIEIAKLAVETTFWPLYEVENGKYKITVKPRTIKPLTDFIKTQRRFAHLDRPQNKYILDELQAQVNKDWEDLLVQEAKAAQTPAAV